MTRLPGAAGSGGHVTAPPIRRASMTPRPWFGVRAALRAALTGSGGGERAARRAPKVDDAPWLRAAARRRAALVATILLVTGAAVALLAAEPVGERDALWLVHLALFGLLFAWVTGGFATALMGFVSMLRGDPHALRPAQGPIDAQARTAIIMPICNEDIATVFGGLQATCASLAATGALRLFDVYVLSDTSKPELRAAELRAWAALRDALGDDARIFYRWRRRRTKRKAGNVADFCRRWGANYRYMVVLDADSVMSGDSLVSLVRLMEANPKAGILQTLPQGCGHDTLHARAQQFLGRVTGRLFAAGLAYWQLGESHYWGHNAIIRVAPFMRHCALAKIPGRGGLAGEILSHDFVEAALMRRAGYEVWIVNVAGSYEQQPPHLIEELQRDRRWCQGNLQNFQLIAEPGFRPVHRAMLASGAMSYAASPLWLAFVVLGMALWFDGDAANLPSAAPWLWGLALAMLFLPRALGIVAVLHRGEQAQFGGTGRLIAGSVVEAMLAVLQAPIRMIAHSLFVLGALTGLRLDWKSPSRDANSVGWSEATMRFGVVGAFTAMLLAIGSARGDASALRLLPMWLPLLLAIPLAVLTSREAIGAWLRRHRLLLVPEEVRVPPLLERSRLAAPQPPQAQTAPARAPVIALPVRTHRPSLARQGWALARAAAFAALVAVPIASMPDPAHQRIAFSYLAAAPAPWVTPTVTRTTLVPAENLRRVSASGVGKRKPLKLRPGAEI